MKKMYFMLLLALAGLGSSCTNEDDSQGQTTLGTAGEIQLLFSGSGDSEEYTKAIASEPESKIGTLKVYLFASAAANATDANWHYLETWTKTMLPLVQARKILTSSRRDLPGKPSSNQAS